MTTRVHRATVVTPQGTLASGRALPEEAAVALSYDGSTLAVLMATPADLEDFARGFTLTEGIAAPCEIDRIEAEPTRHGIDLRVWLRPGAGARLAARRRATVGPVGCGLCGIESLAQADRPVAPVSSALRLSAAQVMAAMADLPNHQPLHDRTRAAHCAAFLVPGRGIVAAREDVGRHNALDKLAGALAAEGVDPGSGAVVLTSRLSLDLVQKAATMGVPVLVCASAPTDAALALAARTGIAVAALARADRFELFTHPERIAGRAAHVA
jgi:FdhD protein